MVGIQVISDIECFPETIRFVYLFSMITPLVQLRSIPSFSKFEVSPTEIICEAIAGIWYACIYSVSCWKMMQKREDGKMKNSDILDYNVKKLYKCFIWSSPKHCKHLVVPLVGREEFRVHRIFRIAVRWNKSLWTLFEWAESTASAVIRTARTRLPRFVWKITARRIIASVEEISIVSLFHLE